MIVNTVIPFLGFLAYFPLLAIMLRHRHTRVHTSFTWYLVAATAWSFWSFMARANVHLDTELCVRFLVVALVWMTVSYYRFVRAFVNRPGGFLVPLGYLFLLATAVLAFTGKMPRLAYTQDGGLYTEYGSYMYLLVGGCVPIALTAAYSLLQRYRRLSDSLDRRRIVYLGIGLGVVIVGGMTNLSSSLGVYPLDHVANLANALIVFYAVLRYQLLDVRIMVRRGLAYSALSIVLTSAYLLLLFLIQKSTLDWPDYGFVALAAGLALSFAVLFEPLREIIQRGVDRMFYGGTYDYRRTLLTFSQRMGNVLNLRELADNMLFPITMALGSRRAFLLLPETDGGDFVVRFAQPRTADPPDGILRLAKDNPIIGWLAREGRVLYREKLDIAPEFKGLWERECDDIDALELELFCPIMRKGGLVGILGLGRKRSYAAYSKEDVDLLTTMSGEAAMVIENAMMLEDVKEHQRRVEQLLAKTVLAQEEERRRISVELHDSVAQWLVGASYRMQTCSALLSSGGNGEAQSELAEIESTIDKSLKEIRRVMAGLHPPALDELGLVHAVRRLSEGLKTSGIAYHFETIGEPVRLAASSELAIYRVVQEALNNVQKHSGASAVVVKLRFDAEVVSVEIHDNGKGFNVPRTMRSAVAVGHMGLMGMNERASMLGATLKLKSKPGAGTSVSLKLPVTAAVLADSVEAGEQAR